jgi:hypothetical protein
VLQFLPEEHPHCEHLSINVPLEQYFGFVDEQESYKVPSEHVGGGDAEQVTDLEVVY